MNMNLLPEPVRSKNLKLEDSRNAIHLRSWSQLQAACFLLGKQPLDLDEFQAYPPGYEVKLQELSKNTSVDPKLLEEILKYKTKYPDIEHHYNALVRIKTQRLSGLKKNDEGNIIEAEPMVWIKLAKENNLFVAPAIDEAWIHFQLRAKKRYQPPKADGSKNTKSTINKRFTNARPMHEPSDIDNIQQLGRNLFRKNPCFTKQKIVQEIFKIYPRAKCYNTCVLIKWMNWANIAPAKKGRPKKASASS